MAAPPEPRPTARDPVPADGPVATEVFRPQRWLRLLVHFGLATWIGIGLHMSIVTGLTAQATGGIAFFLVLFLTIEVVHARTWIAVGPDGLRVRDLGRTREVSFADVRRVDVVPGVLHTSYLVILRGGIVSFTSFFGGHRRLCDLIVERAKLAPSR